MPRDSRMAPIMEDLLARFGVALAIYDGEIDRHCIIARFLNRHAVEMVTVTLLSDEAELLAFVLRLPAPEVRVEVFQSKEQIAGILLQHEKLVEDGLAVLQQAIHAHHLAALRRTPDLFGDATQ